MKEQSQSPCLWCRKQGSYWDCEQINFITRTLERPRERPGLSRGKMGTGNAKGSSKFRETSAQQKLMSCLQLLLSGRASGRLLLLSLEGDTPKQHSHKAGDPGAHPKAFTNPPEEGYSSQIPEEFHWGIAALITGGMQKMPQGHGEITSVVPTSKEDPV